MGRKRKRKPVETVASTNEDLVGAMIDAINLWNTAYYAGDGQWPRPEEAVLIVRPMIMLVGKKDTSAFVRLELNDAQHRRLLRLGYSERLSLWMRVKTARLKIRSAKKLINRPSIWKS